MPPPFFMQKAPCAYHCVGVKHMEKFPQEVVSDVPRVALVGRKQVLIEQHHGLLAYQPEEVLLRTGVGMLRIGGQELELHTYSATEAEVTGCIASVAFAEKGGARE